jgi:hypothetical protein
MCVGLAAAHMITQITWFPRFALQAYPLHDKEGAAEAERKNGKKAWNKRIFFSLDERMALGVLRVTLADGCQAGLLLRVGGGRARVVLDVA